MTPTKPEDALVAELLSLKAFLEAHHCNADAITTLLERERRATEEAKELRAERDALLQKPIDLAKMDSIDEDASSKMVAYYWWQQALEARAALTGEAK
jgi:hypothetical protein